MKVDSHSWIESWYSFGKKPKIETGSKIISTSIAEEFDGTQEVQNEQDQFDIDQILE